jgi:iron complex transport system ATP-binding protein
VLTEELIREVYGVDTTVLQHPRTGRLLLAFSPLAASGSVQR